MAFPWVKSGGLLTWCPCAPAELGLSRRHYSTRFQALIPLAFAYVILSLPMDLWAPAPVALDTKKASRSASYIRQALLSR